MQLEAKTLQEAADQINLFRRYKPYQYSGRWFIGVLGQDVYAYRTKQSLKNKAGKLGIDIFLIGILD